MDWEKGGGGDVGKMAALTIAQLLSSYHWGQRGGQIKGKRMENKQNQPRLQFVVPVEGTAV